MLTKTEYDNIFKYFDKNCDDEVSFLEFISFVRVPLNEFRANVVGKVFDTLDQGRQGTLLFEQLKQLYDASKSWDVGQGRKTIADAVKDFAQ